MENRIHYLQHAFKLFKDEITISIGLEHPEYTKTEISKKIFEDWQKTEDIEKIKRLVKKHGLEHSPGLCIRHIFTCQTCGNVENSICYWCALNCHNGHKLCYIGFGPCKCECCSAHEKCPKMKNKRVCLVKKEIKKKSKSGFVPSFAFRPQNIHFESGTEQIPTTFQVIPSVFYPQKVEKKKVDENIVIPIAKKVPVCAGGMYFPRSDKDFISFIGSQFSLLGIDPMIALKRDAICYYLKEENELNAIKEQLRQVKYNDEDINYGTIDPTEDTDIIAGFERHCNTQNVFYNQKRKAEEFFIYQLNDEEKKKQEEAQRKRELIESILKKQKQLNEKKSESLQKQPMKFGLSSSDKGEKKVFSFQLKK